MQNQLAIKIENLSKSFANNHVLKNISLEVQKGESLVVIGGSGTGKSVLIKNVIGIIQPTSGKIYINDEEVTYASQYKRIKLGHNIGMLFQGSALFDSLNVLENVVFSIAVHKKLDKTEARKIAIENLELVGLSESVLDKLPSELSGGMQKRVALARLIVQKPQIIFFDEPTTGLDPIMSDLISNLIIKTSNYLGATSITITHDMKSAKKIGDKIVMLHEGEIVWQGKPEDIDKSENPIVYNFVRGNSSTSA